MKSWDNVFDSMGELWVEIADKNQADRQISFLRNHLTTDGLLLDLACGSGRHLIPLANAGYDVVGFDISLSLLRIAKKRFSRAVLVRGDMRFLPFREGVFKAVISMDTSFGYLPSVEDDLISLKDLSRVFEETGVFIVDVFNREELMHRYRRRHFLKRLKWILLPSLLKLRLNKLLFLFFKWREYSSFFLLQKRDLSSDGSKLCDLWVFSDKTDGRLIVFRHEVRLYECKQLMGLLSKADFAVRDVYGDYGEQVFSDYANRLIISSTARVNI